MLRRSERKLENIPVGALGLIPIIGCEKLGAKVNEYLVEWRNNSDHQFKDDVLFTGYVQDNYIINTSLPRFGSGEGKGIINESVRGKDVYIMVDVLNYNIKYKISGRKIGRAHV